MTVPTQQPIYIHCLLVHRRPSTSRRRRHRPYSSLSLLDVFFFLHVTCMDSWMGFFLATVLLSNDEHHGTLIQVPLDENIYYRLPDT